MSHPGKRINSRNLKWTFEDSLPCYCYAGAQPALHLGVEHSFSRNFIRWQHRANSTVVQLFRKRSHIIIIMYFRPLIRSP